LPSVLSAVSGPDDLLFFNGSAETVKNRNHCPGHSGAMSGLFQFKIIGDEWTAASPSAPRGDRSFSCSRWLVRKNVPWSSILVGEAHFGPPSLRGGLPPRQSITAEALSSLREGLPGDDGLSLFFDVSERMCLTPGCKGGKPGARQKGDQARITVAPDGPGDTMLRVSMMSFDQALS
jgi:hypothetical protein